ncbi:MAG: ThiF family adenylyltransferase [Planctomycetaceae bacterium]|nr:ThiF family adenylyltransferase [Planctomycetaceae bacterium]
MRIPVQSDRMNPRLHLRVLWLSRCSLIGLGIALEEKNMPGMFHHEEHFRGREAVQKLGEVSIALCGAGALGSHLADNLLRQGIRRLRVIDFDRIEEHNVGTQLYGVSEVGSKKVDVLRNRLFKATRVEIDAIAKQLTEGNAKKFLGGADLVLDTFDNSQSRQVVQASCRASGQSCLHVGLAGDYAEVIWDETYEVPEDGDVDACNYPLARNLVLLAVGVATESLLGHLLGGEKRSYSMTLRDFAVRPMEGARSE